MAWRRRGPRRPRPPPRRRRHRRRRPPRPRPPPAAPEAEKLTEQKEPAKQKTLWDEFKLFSYVEMGATFNLHGGSEGVPGSTSDGWTNTLRYYDIYQGYTFNMAEFSIKRDPDEAFPLGMGLVLTAGQDSQKNHSIGILRDSDDAFPFRNTPKFDIQEAYISGRIPIGNGPVLKVGKFVTLLGYEVIESPLDLNYSRGYLFTLAIPLTTTGGLVSYSFTDWLSAQAGLVLGWDRSNTDNSGPSGTGQIAVTPMKDLSTALNFIVGPEISGDKNPVRWVVDLTANYTGLKDFTFGFNFDYGSQANDVFLTSQGLGDKSRAVVRHRGLCRLRLPEGLPRRAAPGVVQRRRRGAHGDGGRRHAVLDDRDAPVQHLEGPVHAAASTATTMPTSPSSAAGRPPAALKKSQDTLSVSLYYKFF